MAKSLEYYASIISKMYDVTIMKDYELKKIIGDYLKTQLEAQKKLIDVKPYYDDKEEMWDLAIEKVKENPVPITENIINKLGLKIQKDSDDFKMIHAYIHRNLPDYHESLKEYNNQAFKVGLQPENIKKVLANHKLEDVIAKFLEASKTEREWGNSRREEIIYFLRTLKEILGENFNTMDFDKEKAGIVADIIYKLPINKDKNILTRGLGIREAIEIEGVDKISSGTIKKYMGVYSTFFDWCESRGYAESNPFKSLKANIIKGKHEVRYAFSDGELQSMIAEIENYPNGLIKKDYEYWGVIIGMYTGARLNEIAQLEVNDIKQMDNIWYFDINDDNGKMLKTESSKRQIPIHNKLIEYGFIDYINKLKQQKKTRLLHQLTWGRKGYGRNLGRFFNERLLPKLGIKDKNVSFHCLRHTVNTRLRQADVEDSKVKAILGHTGKQDMTDRYAQEGYKLSQLNDAIKKLSY